MRAGIVKSSTITKYARLDVGFYLGDPEPIEKKIIAAETALNSTQAKLQTARAELEAQNARVKNLRESGEVSPL